MFQTILSIIKGASEITPIVTELVHAVLPAFTGAQQDELKSALAQARARSDAAEADFVNASRGR